MKLMQNKDENNIVKLVDKNIVSLLAQLGLFHFDYSFGAFSFYATDNLYQALKRINQMSAYTVSNKIHI